MSLNVYVMGLCVWPAERAIVDVRLEELVYETTRRALGNAGVTRQQIDNVVIAASDEFDGRSISSMLMATPSGAYLKDEIKVTDSGATALIVSAARVASGNFHLGVVASWCKPSKTDVEVLARQKCEPIYTRPLGLNMTITEGLFAQAVTERWKLDVSEIDRRVVDAYRRASRNPRGANWEVPSCDEVAGTPFVASPLRDGHQAPLTDGAVSLVLASEEWVRQHPSRKPIARLIGIGWSTDAYQLGRGRLCDMNSARAAWNMALRQAGSIQLSDVDVFEVESQSGFHEAALVRALGLDDHPGFSPSGGTFAQNPVFCSGLVSMAEAVLQVAGLAGPVQVAGVRRAVGHGSHGFAQQGNVVAVFEAVGT